MSETWHNIKRNLDVIVEMEVHADDPEPPGMAERVLEYIIAYKQAHDGNSPSVRDIAGHINRGLSATHRHLRILAESGKIRMPDTTARGIEVVGGVWQLDNLTIVKWIVTNVSAADVPGDEGNDEALIYNLVHNALGDGKQYSYQPEQDAEIKALYAKYGRNDWE